MATKKKASSTQSSNVKTDMHKFKEGTLASGSGKKVTDRKQAIAIGLSEAQGAEKKPAKKTAKKSKKK
jgi:hypothetical protein